MVVLLGRFCVLTCSCSPDPISPLHTWPTSTLRTPVYTKSRPFTMVNNRMALLLVSTSRRP